MYMQMTTQESVVNLAQIITKLRMCGGNLNKFLLELEEMHNAEAYLFAIEDELSKQPELKRIWDATITRSNRIRMQLIRCKAFELMEQFALNEKRTAAADVSYAKTILFDSRHDILREDDPKREGNVNREKDKDNDNYSEYDKDYQEEENGNT